MAVGDAAIAKPRPKSVRIVYLVSADRTVREDFKKGIETAAKDLQGWYGKQLNGPTFRLNDPVVEVVKSDKDAKWFYSHPNGDNQDDWGFNNGLAEAQRLVGARYEDPEYVWVIYSDGPGNKGRGGSGVTVLPEDDLLGLVGQHPEQKDVKRWIAGLGHELGHAFGLDHPRDTEKYADAIMWMGIYGKYPDKTYLTAEDKGILMKSPFFFHPNGDPVVKPAQSRGEVRLRRRCFREVFARREIGMGGVQGGRQCGIPICGNQPRQGVDSPLRFQPGHGAAPARGWRHVFLVRRTTARHGTHCTVWTRRSDWDSGLVLIAARPAYCTA